MVCYLGLFVVVLCACLGANQPGPLESPGDVLYRLEWLTIQFAGYFSGLIRGTQYRAIAYWQVAGCFSVVSGAYQLAHVGSGSGEIL